MQGLGRRSIHPELGRCIPVLEIIQDITSQYRQFDCGSRLHFVAFTAVEHVVMMNDKFAEYHRFFDFFLNESLRIRTQRTIVKPSLG
ncbi:hypothetical protein D3C71_2063100 [compost metagenome]